MGRLIVILSKVYIMSRKNHLVLFTLLLDKKFLGNICISIICFTEYIRWVPMKQSCPGMPFNLITETEISSEKHQASTIFVIRLFCIKTFSSGVFFGFIHEFRRLYPKKL